jgi:hypothetical protein
MIFLATILDTIIDLIAFRLLHLRGITVALTLILNFLIPYFLFLAFIQSRPLDQQIPALGDFIGNMIVNLVNLTISAVFGYIISAIIFIFSGGCTLEPEF